MVPAVQLSFGVAIQSLATRGGQCRPSDSLGIRSSNCRPNGPALISQHSVPLPRWPGPPNPSYPPTCEQMKTTKPTKLHWKLRPKSRLACPFCGRIVLHYEQSPGVAMRDRHNDPRTSRICAGSRELISLGESTWLVRAMGTSPGVAVGSSPNPEIVLGLIRRALESNDTARVEITRIYKTHENHQ